MRACGRCSQDLLHCHGTLVRHADGELECVDEECAVDVVGHDLLITCMEISSGCCGSTTTGEVGAPERRLAG